MCSFVKIRENSFCPLGAQNPLPVKRNFTDTNFIDSYVKLQQLGSLWRTRIVFYEPFFLIKRYICGSWNILWRKWYSSNSLLAIFIVKNYGDRIMHLLTTRYNLKFRKLTLYGITRPQSIRKSRQISGQTILSSPQYLEFNPNSAKNRDIRMVKNGVTRKVTPVLPIDTL